MGEGDDIDRLLQERRNSIANVRELCLSCTNPSTLHDNIGDGWIRYCLDNIQNRPRSWTSVSWPFTT